MLLSWFEVAQKKMELAKSASDLNSLLMEFPVEELKEIVRTGEVKLAFGPCSTSDDVTCWLDHFKGTAFFDQAIALEQEELQSLMASQQQNEASSQQSSMTYAGLEQIRMKKRLLELQKAKSESTTLQQAGVPVAPAPAPGAQEAAPAQAAPPGPDMNKAAMIQQADAWGRSLARSDMSKVAHQKELLASGDAAGRSVVKLALAGPPGLGATILKKVMENPGAAGAAIAGTAGAAHGLLREGGGVGSALAEGTAGAAAGHAAGSIAGGMHNGASFGDAAKMYGAHVKGNAESLASKARASFNEGRASVRSGD